MILPHLLAAASKVQKTEREEKSDCLRDLFHHPPFFQDGDLQSEPRGRRKRRKRREREPFFLTHTRMQRERVTFEPADFPFLATHMRKKEPKRLKARNLSKTPLQILQSETLKTFW